MLVLTRKPEETIIIDGHIVIKIIRVDGQRVKVGIDAPASVTIDRGEVLHKKGFPRAARIVA